MSRRSARVQRTTTGMFWRENGLAEDGWREMVWPCGGKWFGNSLATKATHRAAGGRRAALPIKSVVPIPHRPASLTMAIATTKPAVEITSSENE